MLIAHAAARLSTDRIGFATLYGARVLVVPRDATLATLRAADPRDVVRGPGGVWTLRRTVVVTHGARLTVRAPEVRELRLASGAQGFADVTAWGADLTFAGARGRPLVVRSWDPRARAPDRMLDDGRSAVAGLAGARVDARDVAFNHLGYFAGVSSGVAIASSYTDPPRARTPLGPSFSRNYFGAHTHNPPGGPRP